MLGSTWEYDNPLYSLLFNVPPVNIVQPSAVFYINKSNANTQKMCLIIYQYKKQVIQMFLLCLQDNKQITVFDG